MRPINSIIVVSAAHIVAAGSSLYARPLPIDDGELSVRRSSSMPSVPFRCPKPNGRFCAGPSLKMPLLIDCVNNVATAHDCVEQTWDQLPRDIVSSTCWESAPAAGDAACSKNCTVYSADGSEFPVPGECTMSNTPVFRIQQREEQPSPSSTNSSTVIRASGQLVKTPPATSMPSEPSSFSTSSTLSFDPVAWAIASGMKMVPPEGYPTPTPTPNTTEASPSSTPPPSPESYASSSSSPSPSSSLPFIIPFLLPPSTHSLLTSAPGPATTGPPTYNTVLPSSYSPPPQIATNTLVPDSSATPEPSFPAPEGSADLSSGMQEPTPPFTLPVFSTYAGPFPTIYPGTELDPYLTLPVTFTGPTPAYHDPNAGATSYPAPAEPKPAESYTLAADDTAAAIASLPTYITTVTPLPPSPTPTPTYIATVTLTSGTLTRFSTVYSDCGNGTMLFSNQTMTVVPSTPAADIPAISTRLPWISLMTPGLPTDATPEIPTPTGPIILETATTTEDCGNGTMVVGHGASQTMISVVAVTDLPSSAAETTLPCSEATQPIETPTPTLTSTWTRSSTAPVSATSSASSSGGFDQGSGSYGDMSSSGSASGMSTTLLGVLFVAFALWTM